MSAFMASPLGQAVREMLDKATDEIISDFQGRPQILRSGRGGDSTSGRI